MVGVFLMAILVEGISKARQRIIRKAKAAHRSPERSDWNPQAFRFGISLMHGT